MDWILHGYWKYKLNFNHIFFNFISVLFNFNNKLFYRYRILHLWLRFNIVITITVQHGVSGSMPVEVNQGLSIGPNTDQPHTNIFHKPIHEFNKCFLTMLTTRIYFKTNYVLFFFILFFCKSWIKNLLFLGKN